MRVVVQRVKEASVVADGELSGKIGPGAVVLFAVHKDDSPEQTRWLANKVVGLRMFRDDQGKMNLSLQDVGGQVLVVSQFTLYADCSQGRRPSFTESATGPNAESIYDKFVQETKDLLGDVQTGKFGAMMEVSLVNDGPVTFIIDAKR